jgi:hypothetical protein
MFIILGLLGLFVVAKAMKSDPGVTPSPIPDSPNLTVPLGKGAIVSNVRVAASEREANDWLAWRQEGDAAHSYAEVQFGTRDNTTLRDRVMRALMDVPGGNEWVKSVINGGGRMPSGVGLQVDGEPQYVPGFGRPVNVKLNPKGLQFDAWLATLPKTRIASPAAYDGYTVDGELIGWQAKRGDKDLWVSSGRYCYRPSSWPDGPPIELCGTYDEYMRQASAWLSAHGFTSGDVTAADIDWEGMAKMAVRFGKAVKKGCDSGGGAGCVIGAANGSDDIISENEARPNL